MQVFISLFSYHVYVTLLFKKLVQETNREKQRQTQIEFPYVGSLPKCPQRQGWTGVRTMNQKLNSCLPGRWQGPKYLNHYLLPLMGMYYQETGIRGQSLAFGYWTLRCGMWVS